MRRGLGRILLLAAATLMVGSTIGVSIAQAGTPKCFGKKATIVSNKATVNGTNKADVIVAGGGNNVINGKGGADLICAGGGTDIVKAGGGNDKVNGGLGSDGVTECLVGTTPSVFLDGGPGNDVVVGGAGDDCLGGGPGNDSLSGNAGNDILFGDEGTDKLNGGSNGNPLVDPTQLGDTANFIYMSAAVNATLTSPATATSGSETDTLTDVENLFGSSFADTLTGNSASALPSGPVNGLEGGPGDDTIDGNGGVFEIAAYLLAPPDSTGAGETVSPSGSGTKAGLKGTATGGEGSDTLDNILGVAGSQFNDNLTWGGVAIYGSGGNDTINVFANVGTIVYGGTGDDTVNGSSGNDVVYGEDGNDTLDGAAGTQDAGSGGAGTDSCKNFEVDLTTGGAVGASGYPADCESA